MRLYICNKSLVATIILQSYGIYWSENILDNFRLGVTRKHTGNMFTLSELVVLMAVLSATASGYFVSIDAHAEECFYERVNSGTKMGLMFEVAEGGFLDIDVEVN